MVGNEMIVDWIEAYFKVTERNEINEAIAIDSSVIGLKLFNQPIYGVADAMDPIFLDYATKDEILYQKFLEPIKWLDTAKSVISIFLPYSDAVIAGNAKNLKKASVEWLHGRYEGQQLVLELTKYIKMKIESEGYECVAPLMDTRMLSQTGTHTVREPMTFKDLSNRDYWSNWSERHVAFASGLGTFGLSKNIITNKGVAGRFTSFITNMDLVATNREYTDVYEYCTKCGKCVENCPVNAISFEKGKMHTPCSRYLDWVMSQNTPRYACGKCQVSVPCQSSRP